MVLGRFKDAVTDVAETIRRAFQDPPCRAIATPIVRPGTDGVRPLEAHSCAVAHGFEPGIGAAALAFPARILEPPMRLETQLCEERAWDTWAAGAKVFLMPVFRTGPSGRVTVPALPRAAAVRTLNLPAFRAPSRAIREVFRAPAVLARPLRLSVPRVRRDVEAMLALPIAIPGEDFQRLPKVLNMRYTFQLVKATGENIRNLDVLGIYLVPDQGVTSLRHDARTGRILVNLGPAALGAPRRRFLLARKKDDRGFVSCFVED